MHRLVIPIPNEPTSRALVEYAEQNFRDPRSQAALFVVEGLRRAGALPTEDTTLTTIEASPAAATAAP